MFIHHKVIENEELKEDEERRLLGFSFINNSIHFPHIHRDITKNPIIIPPLPPSPGQPSDPSQPPSEPEEPPEEGPPPVRGPTRPPPPQEDFPPPIVKRPGGWLFHRGSAFSPEKHRGSYNLFHKVHSSWNKVKHFLHL